MANSIRLTSGARCMFAVWIWKIFSFVLISGNGSSIFLSIRPGRMRAGSSVSILFVAMMTLMSPLSSKPSSWLRSSSIVRWTSRSPLEDEVQRLKDIVDAQEKEINTLRENNHDNEFKKCLRGVARKLGGVLKEEEVNFVNQDNFDDDDQLISKVDALTVYVVERKCQNCVRHKEQEEQMRALLSVVVDPDDEDISFFDFITLVREKCDEMMDTIAELKQKKNNLEKDLQFFKTGYEPILSILKKDTDDEREYSNVICESLNKLIDDHNKEVQLLAATKDEELNHFADNVYNKFTLFVELNNADIEGTAVQKASKISDLAMERVDKELKRCANVERILAQVRDRLAKFLEVPPPIFDLDEAPLKLLDELETRPNPLQESLSEAIELNKFLISSVEIVNNRFRGVSMVDVQKPTSAMTPKALVNTTIKMLEHFQDLHERTVEELEQKQYDYDELRRALENVDLKAHKFLGYDDVNLKDIPAQELIDRTDKFLSEITQKQVSNKYIAKADLDPLFSDVYDLVPVTTRTDPMKYIPEVNNAFISLNNSIMALKPFAATLNEIFSSFDCKLHSFLPGSSECKALRQQIMQLHASLSHVLPSKMNSLVFLVLSRFIALLSSFLSALTAISYSADDEQAKNFLFSLQQENERLNNLLQEHNIQA